MIKEVIKYAIVCDGCGRTFRDRFWGKNAFDDEVTARERANDDGWFREGSKHYCPECYETEQNRRIQEKINKKKRSK